MNSKPTREDKYRTSQETLQAASSMDCTGLIPAAPASPSQYSAYLDLYPFLPQAEEKGDLNP